MLHHAYYWREHAPVDPAEGSVQRYVMSWGRPGDAAVIAYSDSGNVGAAWYRLFKEREPGYGFVDEQTPELSIAVVPSRRGKGFGDELLSALLARADDPAAAEKALSDLRARGVDAEPVRRELAGLLHRRGRLSEALALLGDAGKSRDPATLDVYGAVLAESGRFEDARAAFRRALELEPGRADVLLHLGMLSLREKDPAAARDWFMKSLEAEPAAAGTLAALGLAQAQLGDARAALASWDRALVLDPTQYDTLFNRAVLAGRTGDAEGARRGLERFIASAPANRYSAQIAEARRLLRALPAGRS